MQYRAKDATAEMEFSSISNLDLLGTANTLLPGQVKAMGVELETDGYRLGFPKGSHCDEKNRGGEKDQDSSGTITSHRTCLLPSGALPIHAQYRT